MHKSFLQRNSDGEQTLFWVTGPDKDQRPNNVRKKRVDSKTKRKSAIGHPPDMSILY
jgi:hypothetical protein